MFDVRSLFVFIILTVDRSLIDDIHEATHRDAICLFCLLCGSESSSGDRDGLHSAIAICRSRVSKRTPWLLIIYATASCELVLSLPSFEDSLLAIWYIAFLLMSNCVLGIGGQSGNQTITLLVDFRALSIG